MLLADIDAAVERALDRANSDTLPVNIHLLREIVGVGASAPSGSGNSGKQTGMPRQRHLGPLVGICAIFLLLISKRWTLALIRLWPILPLVCRPSVWSLCTRVATHFYRRALESLYQTALKLRFVHVAALAAKGPSSPIRPVLSTVTIG